MKASARKSQLDQLESKLRTALRRETTNVIEIGGLLIKSSKLLKHGEWLDWLKDHFDLSQRTAHNYYSAAEYNARKGKLATVANLAPGLLYALAAGHYNEQEEAAILAATHKGRVDQTRADAICQTLKPPAPAADNDDAADNILMMMTVMAAPMMVMMTTLPMMAVPMRRHGNPRWAAAGCAAVSTDPPPPDFALEIFDKAVTALKQLLTKPAAEFASTVHSTIELETVESFIRAVAKRASRSHPERKWKGENEAVASTNQRG